MGHSQGAMKNLHAATTVKIPEVVTVQRAVCHQDLLQPHPEHDYRCHKGIQIPHEDGVCAFPPPTPRSLATESLWTWLTSLARRSSSTLMPTKGSTSSAILRLTQSFSSVATTLSLSPRPVHSSTRVAQ